MEIIHTNSHTEASRLRDKGYCPIECSFGTLGSVVDSLVMDHHGEYSHTTGVAVRAYKEHFGARKDDQRFVVTGAADADATFCIAALIGELPHPSRREELENRERPLPPPIIDVLSSDIGPLADMVNRIDVNPIGVDRSLTREGRLHLLWQQMTSGVDDATAFHAGVDRWRKLCGPTPPNALIEATGVEEANRIKVARAAEVLYRTATVAAVTCPRTGFDVWYDEIAPIIVALNPNNNNLTVGCVSEERAASLLGEGGLKNIFPKLGEGWGGREAIGGSPRGQVMTREDAIKVAQVIFTASVW